MPGSVSDKLMGLLSDPRTMDIGMGLLSAGGPSFTPHNMGQDIASAYQYANGREGQRNQLEMQRAQLSQQKKQAAARAQLGQIMANRQTPQQIGQGVAGQMGILGSGPGMLNPQTQAQYGRATAGLNAINNQRQQQIPGLLMEAYPNQAGGVMAGLLGGNSQPKMPTDYNAYIAMGGDPNDMAAYQEFKNGPEDPLREAQLTKLMSDMQADLESRRKAADEDRTNKEIVSIGIESGVTDMIKLYDVNSKLEDSPLQSGVPLSDIRRAFSGGAEAISDLFGLDNNNAANLNEQFDLFKKISNDFAVNSQGRLGGSGSNFRLQSTLDANANLSAAPATNRYVIASNLKELMAQARARNVVIPERERRAAQEIIDSVFSAPGATPPVPDGFVPEETP